jgi:hypothetical protein
VAHKQAAEERLKAAQASSAASHQHEAHPMKVAEVCCLGNHRSIHPEARTHLPLMGTFAFLMSRRVIWTPW